MPSLPLMNLNGGIFQRASVFAREALVSAQTSMDMASIERSSAHGPEFHQWDQRASSLGYSSSFNASAVLAWQQQRKVQIIATTFSSISILAGLTAVFWFCMMRRNFRRDLVLSLIVGDLGKSCWFLIFSTVTLSGQHITTHSDFCQGSGYLLQASIISCDVAVFLMSLHMYLQIFPPSQSIFGHDGLYRVRGWALALLLIWPNLSASLAFANADIGYIFQGGFCSLPIRPFWFRLALSWVPRYLNMLFLLGVAFRIYSHVGYEFKVFGQVKDQSSSVRIPGFNSFAVSSHIPQRTQTTQLGTMNGSQRRPSINDDEVAPNDNRSALGRPLSQGLPETARPAQFNPNRRQSMPNWVNGFGGSTVEKPDSIKFAPGGSTPASRRGSRLAAAGTSVEDFAHPTPFDPSRNRGSISTVASIASAQPLPVPIPVPVLDTITEAARSSTCSGPEDMAARAMKQRRTAIQRQLRLLFIYPVVYMILWVMAFVAHAMSYSNHYAQHPIFAVSVLNVFCQCVMGTADVCVFSWREKPWRHIPGSSGTFFGSFLFWRYVFGGRWSQGRRASAAPSHGEAVGEEKERSESQKGLLGSLKRWSLSISGMAGSNRASHASTATDPSSAPTVHRRAHSGGSERRIMEAERAHERLARERADFEQNQHAFSERRASVISTTAQQTTPGRKEWWERRMSVNDETEDEKEVV